MTKLEAKNIIKYFSHDSHKLTALGGVNLKVESGDFVCLIGPSGVLICSLYWGLYLKLISGVFICNLFLMLVSGVTRREEEEEAVNVT